MVSLGSGSFGRKLSNSVGQKVGVRWALEVWVGVGGPVAVGGLGGCRGSGGCGRSGQVGVGAGVVAVIVVVVEVVVVCFCHRRGLSGGAIIVACLYKRTCNASIDHDARCTSRRGQVCWFTDAFYA